jgi:CheY-like chemotaxis protein
MEYILPKENSLKDLMNSAQGKSILFVDDNEKLREQMGIFLENLFDTYYLASNGEEGLELFKKHRPDIIVTDLKMPIMGGFEMIKEIRTIDKDSLIIISSAFKEMEYLTKAIELEVFRYLSKPINVKELAKILVEAFSRIDEKIEKSKFKSDMHRIFNYQNSMIFLLEDDKVTLANERFLHYFDVETESDFNEKVSDIKSLFLDQKGFFTPPENKKLLDYIMHDTENVYNAKLKNTKGTIQHFILSVQRDFEDKHAICSLSDITSLNLLPLFDIPKSTGETQKVDSSSMYAFLEQIFESGASIQFFNTYKGLPITHDAIFNYITSSKIGFTSHLQQIKAISLEDKTYLSSSLLPQDILLNKIDSLSLKNSEVIFEMGNFVGFSPMMRKVIRLEPNSDHMITLLQHDSKLPMSATIKDVSIKAVSLSIPNFMPTLQKDDVIQVDMVFTMNRQKMIINRSASIYKIIEFKKHHEVVLILSLDKQSERTLTQYILKRQMELIREFKGRIDDR